MFPNNISKIFINTVNNLQQFCQTADRDTNMADSECVSAADQPLCSNTDHICGTNNI